MAKSHKNSPGTYTLHGGFKLSYSDILLDYRMAWRSRHMSTLARREVLTGKASFGIVGDGIEIPQIAMAKAFQNGDFRSGYYRDQTVEMALGHVDVSQFFAQLYSNTDVKLEPNSAGRQMNSHFATRLVQNNGDFVDQRNRTFTAAELSPTAGQMSKLLGLAYASKVYRQSNVLKGNTFSNHGNEVVFGSIGDASTSEGVFFETLNAAGVLQVPLLMSVWDNGYGISVPRMLQTVNDSISKALSGFASDNEGCGITIYQVQGWDYLKCCDVYQRAVEKVRKEHKPALVHVVELTQPQGHSTSGSHERYKPKDRLDWEKDFCCLVKMKAWILEQGITSENVLSEIEAEEFSYVKQEQKKSWQQFTNPLELEKIQALEILQNLPSELKQTVHDIEVHLKSSMPCHRRLIESSFFKICHQAKKLKINLPSYFLDYYSDYRAVNISKYRSQLYSDTPFSPLNVSHVPAVYDEQSEVVDGRVVLLKCFDLLLERDSRIFALGEDVGKLGDVNLVFEGLNAKYGDLRITDTGIRENTILGQGIGCAMRGLRPLVDIQYLDYFLYALQTASDDLASLFYRTAGGQKSPVIIRTKGHRLEGIWHTGSPLSVLLGALRGIYLCVPRNMTQAAGMYNTLFQGDNPGVVIEVLNGYRLKEKVPLNLGQFTVPLGYPEVLREGSHVTVITYGACCRVAMEAAILLEEVGIFAEIIDVQTLVPFDNFGVISGSLKKTNAVVFLDEDVPGGTSAFMMQQTLEKLGGFHDLDCSPRTVTAAENRGAFGRDGDYYCKPQAEDVFRACVQTLRERGIE